MKTIDELHAWLSGAADVFGDPALTTGQVFARYRPTGVPGGGDIVARYVTDTLILHLGLGNDLELPLDPDGPQVDEETGGLTVFGIRQISSGLWTLMPSLNMPGLIHAFVTIYDVPPIAPWESRIIVVKSFREAANGK